MPRVRKAVFCPPALWISPMAHMCCMLLSNPHPHECMHQPQDTHFPCALTPSRSPTCILHQPRGTHTLLRKRSTLPPCLFHPLTFCTSSDRELAYNLTLCFLPMTILNSQPESAHNTKSLTLTLASCNTPTCILHQLHNKVGIFGVQVFSDDLRGLGCHRQVDLCKGQGPAGAKFQTLVTSRD